MHEEKGIKNHTKGEKLKQGRNPRGKDEKWEKRVFGRSWIAFLSREIWKSEIWFCNGAIDGMRICQALNLDR